MLASLPRDVLVHICLACDGEDGIWLALTLRLVCKSMLAKLAVAGPPPSPWPRLLAKVRSAALVPLPPPSPSAAFGLILRLLAVRERMVFALPPQRISNIEKSVPERVHAIVSLGADAFLVATVDGAVLRVHDGRVLSTMQTSLTYPRVAAVGREGRVVVGGRATHLEVHDASRGVVCRLTMDLEPDQVCRDLAVSDGIVAGIFNSSQVAFWRLDADDVATAEVSPAQVIALGNGQPRVSCIICLDRTRGKAQFLLSATSVVILLVEAADGSFSSVATWRLPGARGRVTSMAAERISPTSWHVVVSFLFMSSSVLVVKGQNLSLLAMQELPEGAVTASRPGLLCIGGGGMGGGRPVNFGFTLVPHGVRKPARRTGARVFSPNEPVFVPLPDYHHRVPTRPTALAFGDTMLLIGDDAGRLLAAEF